MTTRFGLATATTCLIGIVLSMPASAGDPSMTLVSIHHQETNTRFELALSPGGTASFSLPGRGEYYFLEHAGDGQRTLRLYEKADVLLATHEGGRAAADPARLVAEIDATPGTIRIPKAGIAIDVSRMLQAEIESKVLEQQNALESRIAESGVAPVIAHVPDTESGDVMVHIPATQAGSVTVHGSEPGGESADASEDTCCVTCGEVTACAK